MRYRHTPRHRDVGFKVDLAHIPTTDAEERLHRTYALVFRAAARASDAGGKGNPRAEQHKAEETNHE